LEPGQGASNKRKHGVSFETAVRVFSDPFALGEQDRIEGGEYRWQTIGSVDGVIVLFVAHTGHDDGGTEIIHIISARRAGRHERKRYEEAKLRYL
jgi:uncharacterized DUF497 family protein